MADRHHEPVLDVAHGDEALSRHLRQSLRVLKERSDSEEFRRLVDEVLSGRRGLRDVYLSPAFAAGLDSGVQQFARRYGQLSPEERAELAEQGVRDLQDERDRIAREGG